MKGDTNNKADREADLLEHDCFCIALTHAVHSMHVA